MKPQKLKRLIKPKALQAYIEKAQPQIPAGALLSVKAGSAVLACVGSSSARIDSQKMIHLDLEIKNMEPACLCLVPPAGCDSGSLSVLQDVGNFLAFGLREILEREIARRAVTEETLEQYREAALLHRATMALNQSLLLGDVTRALLDECESGAISSEMGLVLSYSPECDVYKVIDGFGPFQNLGLAEITTSRLFQEIVLGTKGEIINDLGEDPRWKGEVPGLHSLLCIPLKSPGHWTGVLVLANGASAVPFAAADLKRIATIASVAATAMANAHHFEEVRTMLDAIMQALATAIDSRDPCTSGHSQRVAHFAMTFAQVLDKAPEVSRKPSFTEAQLKGIYYAGLLHDVGKIGIREEVLTKNERLSPGHIDIIFLRLALFGAMTSLEWKDDYQALCRINKANVISDDQIELVKRLADSVVQVGSEAHPLLTRDEKDRLLIPRGNLMPAEWQEIRRHPAESHRILQHIPFPSDFGPILTIIRQHHEKLNGKGYPDGIRNEAILLQSRILAIVDVYDALTATDRPYKKALPQTKALSILKEETELGNMDTELVDLFCRHVRDITEI